MAASDNDTQKIWNVILGVLGGLIMLGITVVGSLLWQGNASIVRLQTGQETIAAQVAALQVQLASGVSDRYTGRDAARDFTAAEKIIESLKTQVNQIDQRQRDALVRLHDVEAKVGIKNGS